jgi:Fe2+ or Zn2+ uptake regulation protein
MQKYGFQANFQHVIVNGLCEACKNQAN